MTRPCVSVRGTQLCSLGGGANNMSLEGRLSYFIYELYVTFTLILSQGRMVATPALNVDILSQLQKYKSYVRVTKNMTHDN